MTIGVFFGGRNTEHDISIITGQLVISVLKKLGYRVVPVYVDKQGQWSIGDELASLKFFSARAGQPLPKRNRFYLDLEQSAGRMVFCSKGLFRKTAVVDLAFPTFHGMNGEDGTIQGLFELLGTPYVGCEVAASAMTIDKILTKQIFQLHKIPAPRFQDYTAQSWDGKVKGLKWPLFVKPAKLGSSIGVAKVTDQSELEQAAAVALKYGERFLVEEAVDNLMDITCAVMGNQNPEASLLQESVFEDQLFSYDDKYLKDGGAQLGNDQKRIVIPARLDQKTTEHTRQMAVDIFRKFSCSGIARVDFLYDKKSKKIYANEINTMPGTLYHHLWKASGKSIEEVVTNLLKLAQERFAIKQSLQLTFESSLLQHANAIKLQLKDD